MAAAPPIINTEKQETGEWFHIDNSDRQNELSVQQAGTYQIYHATVFNPPEQE